MAEPELDPTADGALHEAFYLPTDEGGDGGDTFVSTGATASPWDDSLQHGGPPAALLARAVERARPDASMPIARITVDMLGGIGQGRIRTEAEVVRPGKRIEMVVARLYVEDRLAVSATAWRIRTGAGSTAEHDDPVDLPAVPDASPRGFFPGVSPDWGYGRAFDWRYVEGGLDVLGPARVWVRPRIPLVAGEETSPVSRLLSVADSTNGVSGRLPLAQWWFIPPTVTVTVQRPPASEWMLLDAATTIGPDGVGLAQGTMYDERGLCAVVAQPLMVAPR